MKRLVFAILLAAAPCAAHAASPSGLLDERLTFSFVNEPSHELVPWTEAYWGGGRVSSGINLIVAGSILGVIGTLFAAPGVYFLVQSGSATGETATTYTALGWTFVGVGALLLAIGIPLLVVGIVKLATRYASREWRPAATGATVALAPIP